MDIVAVDLPQILATARLLPPDAMAGVDLPLPDAERLPYELGWRGLPEETRRGLIVETAASDPGEAVRALYLLWSWESEPDLRQQIVASFPTDRSTEARAAQALLKIFVNEIRTSVRVAVREKLTRMRDDDQGSTPPRPRSAIRTRGAVRARGGAQTGPPRQTAAEALARIEELLANPASVNTP